MITFALTGHPLLMVQSFRYERTFPGLLEGYPPPEVVTERLRHARAMATGGWLTRLRFGPAKTRYHFHEPIILDDRLPSLFCIAEVDSSTPVNPGFMASTLRIGWFMDSELVDLRKDIGSSLKDLNWNKYATDFNY